MDQQLYERMVAEYSVGVSNNEDFIPSEDIEGITEILTGKMRDEDLEKIGVRDISIEHNEDDSYSIEVKYFSLGEELGNKGRINYSPNEQRCVTHGNMVLDERPPEGKSYDGNGNTIGGIR